MVKVAIFGASGKMGRKLMLLALHHPEMELVGAISRHEGTKVRDLEPQLDTDLIIRSSLHSVSPRPDVVVDFSLPEGTRQCVRECLELRIPLIIGTTGVPADLDVEIKTASSTIPCEIVEAHHDKKVDAPSGTALALADSVCEATGRTRKDLVHGREGNTGKRTQREIGMHAVRLGSVVGDHTVMFGSEFERLEFTHKAQSKEVFADGALKAARWISKKRDHPRMYTMQDVLQLQD